MCHSKWLERNKSPIPPLYWGEKKKEGPLWESDLKLCGPVECTGAKNMCPQCGCVEETGISTHWWPASCPSGPWMNRKTLSELGITAYIQLWSQYSGAWDRKIPMSLWPAWAIQWDYHKQRGQGEGGKEGTKEINHCLRERKGNTGVPATMGLERTPLDFTVTYWASTSAAPCWTPYEMSPVLALILKELHDTGTALLETPCQDIAKGKWKSVQPFD